jgi:hypothetical protein
MISARTAEKALFGELELGRIVIIDVGTTKTEPSYDHMAIKASTRHYRGEISQSMPPTSDSRRNPSGPRRLGRRRHMTLQNCESRAH